MKNHSFKPLHLSKPFKANFFMLKMFHVIKFRAETDTKSNE